MSNDRLRQILTVATFVVTVAVNWAANAVPINGQTTGEISDRFQVLVIPAGYVFSIWGLIYLLLAAFTIDQARPSRASDPTLRRLGWLPALTGVLNTAWLIAFQFEAFVSTVPIMVALLVTLIRICHITFADQARLTGAARWTVRLPFSVYLGWITVATIANVAQTLRSLGVAAAPEVAPVIAAGVLGLGLAIALTYVRRYRDVAYGAVIVWAYIGIAVKEQATPLVLFVAIGGAIAVGCLMVAVTTGRRRAGTPA